MLLLQVMLSSDELELLSINSASARAWQFNMFV
jgi:hypothetical protein